MNKKTSIIAVYDFKLPTFLICPLVNDDLSGIEDYKEDMISYKKALKTFNELMIKEKGSYYIIDYNEDEEEYFSHYPDFNSLGGTVIDIKLNIMK